jgi:hypothetical protein
MNDKKTVFERYPHLLGGQTDPAMVALVEELDTLYRAPEPPAHLTLAAVLAQCEEEDTPARSLVARWSFRPLVWLPSRASMVVIAVALAVALMASSVYAVTAFLHSGLEPPPFDQGVSQVFKENLLDEVNVAPQTIDGFTMNVQAAYADPNRVIIGYTMTKPSGQSYDTPWPSDTSLTTTQGDNLRAWMNGPLSGNAYTATFTPLAWISSTAHQIALHLSVHQIDVNAGAQHLTLRGSMSFTFSAPFHSGRIAHPDLAATANGMTLTLEHVVVSPSLTRLFVQGIGVTTTLYPTLTVSGWQSKEASFVEVSSVNADEIAISYPVSLFDTYGEWTLTLQQTSFDPPAPHGVGPAWTFQFVVP